MATAFEHFIATRRDVGGIISAGGSGGTSLATHGHARAADRRAEGDGLAPWPRRHAALRRPERHLHDVFGHRRAGHQPHQREGAGQRRARAGRHDRAPAVDRSHHQAGDRPDDVRRDHALRAGGDQAARRRLRLPGLPRHRHRRPDDGEAGRLRPARRRDRRHHHRDRRRDRRRRALGRADAAGRVRAPRAALRRLVRRARHGQLRRLGHGARALQEPQALPTQPDRDADAHHGRRVPRDRRVHRRQAQRMHGPVRFLIPEGGVSAIDKPGQPSTTPRPTGRCSTAIARELPRRHRPQADPPAAAHQRRSVRRRAGRCVARDRRASARAAQQRA